MTLVPRRTLHSAHPPVPLQTEADLAALRDENRRLRALVDFSRGLTAERDLRAQLRLFCAELQRSTASAAVAVILRGTDRSDIELIETAGIPSELEAEWAQSVRAGTADID